ncbi:tRNA pseudouridine(55) synthase TruB [Alkalibacter saccharofermentans]|uniref:tRNA pseudouridine synthase B n=1 Tax=Alkalibacter saccharofermentans DSM 14828 TaxID=1120975 RepID=A0A1M4S6S2_9FIRM|nr:tRNA pseudouridine(55) synthase TruB [Alkalibacter saccharofermentans]SHE27875.1 tRNA pseudouridine synthase B [Alkalibacter saccharofermentans DSM 14828]
MDGILNIYKPKGKTSHDMVNILRRALNTKKIGHTGTLDPLAEGVLPLCVGKATRVSQYMLDKEKEYVGELKLGISTDTYDSEGKEVKSRLVSVTENQILDAVDSFKGELLQKPPIYSALKVRGKKLYEYAREGVEVEIEPRRVVIHDIEIVSIQIPYVKIRVGCSKGTYIRSLFNDIGEKLGCGAHMTSLIRTKSGYFSVDDAITLDKLEKMDVEAIAGKLYPTDFPLKDFPKILIDPDSKKYLVNGNVLYGRNLMEPIDTLAEGQKVLLYCLDRFYGIGEIIVEDKINKIKPKCIFNEEK